jgi:flagellar assembly protein FliH
MSSKLLSGTVAAAIEWRAVAGAAGARRLAQSPHAAPAGEGLDQLLREAEARSEEHARRAFAEGRAAGEQEGAAAAGRRLDPLIGGLEGAIQELAGLKKRVRQQADRDLIQLSMAIARRILHREVSIDPAALEGIVKAALERLDARELHRIRAAPDQIRLIGQIRSRLSLPARVELVEDRSLAPGAILFETERGDLDASVETQLAEIERGLTDIVGREGS